MEKWDEKKKEELYYQISPPIQEYVYSKDRHLQQTKINKLQAKIESYHISTMTKLNIHQKNNTIVQT